ncbi:competence protein ComFB [Desulfovibrio aerotolerans]|uniref:Competence protein ComFB n=1 Tax=Solidesulfovibrio aerotolerans TaxID=295255 RepID=A0A7C9MVG9_9BACT|nr:late competence development ComFB family protein [Solidesulfovibrio aerotolerans]MYL83574.1 competence protein ComFB [Solidesulfovibrio aerotolerans]
MDYAALGLDFHSIRNRNETRVINLLPGVLAEFPNVCPTRTDIEDIYALTLNKLPARYVQAVSLVIQEPVSDEMIREMLRDAVRTVRARPNC